jgi:pyridoxine 4-dehydrogenase
VHCVSYRLTLQNDSNAVVPIAAVEVEFSLFETSILHNGVAETCATLNIPIVAYSPLGRGILTGKVTSAEDLPAPIRRHNKYQGENLNHNLRLVKELQKLVDKKKGSSLSILALSWVRQFSGRDGWGVFVPISGSTKAENVRSNAQSVELTDEDFSTISELLKNIGTVGERGYGEQKKYLEG